jgi:DNA polymerase-3 subunit delta'
VSVWDDVVGQQDAVAVLRRAVEQGPMTHAWLLTGPPGSGRSTAARAFAAALQCERGTGCGECHECRTALGGSHPDVALVATEHVFLRVEDVRPLVTLAQQRPSLGRWRVIVVEDADRLNDTSGNLLLKAVEEPPPRTVWLLCAPSPDDVLVTIRSRCRHVGLRVPPVRDVAELLVRRHGVDPPSPPSPPRAAGATSASPAARLDEGARIRRRDVLKLPGALSTVGTAVLAAAELVSVAAEEAKDATAERDAAERRPCCTRSEPRAPALCPPAVRAQVKQLEENQKRRATRAQRDVLDRSLVDLLSLYRDVLVVQLGADVELVNAELADEVQRLARASSPDGTVRRMDAIGVARERISANVAPLLAVEALMVELRPAAGTGSQRPGLACWRCPRPCAPAASARAAGSSPSCSRSRVCTSAVGGQGVGEPTPVTVTGSAPTGRSDPATSPALARFYGQRVSWSSCAAASSARR